MTSAMERPIPTHVGPYRLLYLLGSGGMGQVFAAEHEQMGQQVALKLLSPAAAREPQLVARFLQEARALAQLDHPGVVRVLHCDRQGDTAFLAMERLHGMSLREWMQRPAPTLRSTLALAQQIADIMGDVHALGIVHRDLKPENVFLCPDEGSVPGYRVKLLDFGIAKLPPVAEDALGATQLHTHESAFMGTYLYMAPEQFRKATAVDGRADVYALGVLLFEMLAGRRPFASEDPVDVISAHLREEPPPVQQFAPELPGGLSTFIASMLAKNPAERPTMWRCKDLLGWPWETERDTCPVPGLAPFTETQVELFFGREDETRTLLALLDEVHAGRRRWLQLEGPSGVGKSSLLQAGLLPRLQQATGTGAPKWRVVSFRPTFEPIRALARALTSACVSSEARGMPDALEQALRTDVHALRNFVTAHTSGESCLLLVLEPMEELFTLGADECLQMDELLTHALAAPDCPLRLLTSLRSDFLHRIEQVPSLAKQLQHAARYPLLPMEETALDQVIQGMARHAGLRLSEGLATRMVRDARSEGSRLPLLGHALRGLWVLSRGAPLTHAHYEQLGGVGGALAQQAEALLDSLGQEGRMRAKWLLLSLVRIGRGVPGTRRPRSRREVFEAAGGDALAEEVLLRLSGMPAGDVAATQAGMRLVLLSGGPAPEQQRADLVHEMLLYRVPSIVAWMEQERALLERYAELEVAAHAWEQTKCSVEDLPTGTLLAHYRGETRTVAQRVSPSASRYLQAAEKEERRRAEQKRLLRAASVLAVLAILFYAALAEYERRRAEQAQRHAEDTLQKLITTMDEFAGGLDWKLSWLPYTLDLRRQKLEEFRKTLSSLPSHQQARSEVRRVEVEVIHRQADLSFHDETLANAGQYLSESREKLLAAGVTRIRDARLLRLLALDHSKHGKVEHARGNLKQAHADFSEAIRLLERPDLQSDDPVDDQRTLAVSLQELAEAELASGNLEAARKLLDRAIQLHELHVEAYNQALLALALSKRGEVARHAGQPDAARGYLDRALRMARSIHAPTGDQYSRWVLARVLVEFAAFQVMQGQPGSADSHYDEARQLGLTLREGESPSKRYTLVWLDAIAGQEALARDRGDRASESRLHTDRCAVARDFQTMDEEDVRFLLPDCQGIPRGSD